MLATSTVLRSPMKPAWQTEELEDEWIEPSSAHEGHALVHSHSNIPHLSLATVAPPSPTLSLHHSPPSLTPPGTFLIREDQPAAPILPRPLGKSRSKSLIKDFFSPLALETMFEPPSPRAAQGSQAAVPSRLNEAPVGVENKTELGQSEEHGSNNSLGEDDMEEETNSVKVGNGGQEHELLEEGEEDVILTSDIPNLASFDGRKPSSAYKFTFSAPQRLSHMSRTIAKSTPAATPARVPATDPRLRLFQFQYDTYTREHLSAMVDSIAVNTPSSDASKNTPRQTGAATESDVGFIRATKRLRLTPPQELSDALRPRRDYIGESRHLMQKIKQARTPSMMTTLSIKENIQPTNMEDHSIEEDRPRRLPIADARSVWSSDTPSEVSNSAIETDKSRRPSSIPQPSAAYASSSLLLAYPTSTLTPSMPSSLLSSTSNSQSKPSSIASALGYRRQAADLMAQIRKDMTTGKRLVSLEIPKDDGKKSQPPSPVLQRKPSRVTLSPRKDRIKSKDSEKPPLPVVRKVPKPSPRKLLRRLSAADEVDRELALNKSGSDASLGAVEAPEIEPKHLPLPSPSPSPPPQLSRQPPTIQVFHMSDHTPNPAFLLPQAPGDAGRVVSGGTTTSIATTDTALTRGTSATSVSAASVGSFVKHPGPVQMMRIAPSDLPNLPDTVGGMRFDREMMRWVKDEVKGSEEVTAPEESEDPFKSFESLESRKEDEVEEPQAVGLEESPADVLDAIRNLQADEDTDDSFEFDAEGSAAAVVEVMTGVDSRDSETETETTDSEAGDARPDLSVNEATDQSEDEDQAGPEDVTAKIPAPAPTSVTTASATPIPLHREPRAPPRSALKQTNGSTQDKTPAAALRTPNNFFSAAHRRSVSFSDGRKDGKIQGLGRDGRAESPTALPASGSGSTFVPSARGKRIADILENFMEPSFEEQTPSKASTTTRPSNGAIQPLASRSQSQSQLVAGATRRTFARSQGGKDLSLAQGNQTFLTECSFGVAQDKLVQVITDVHPYVPYWESLLEIDLSGKGVDSVVRLKEFLPQLDALKIDANMLSWLTGVPRTVRTLSVAANSLTVMTSFSHLTNLENLDISNNQIDSLQQLSCLRHLRELKADGNSITSLDGLADLDGLTKLSLKGNRISEVDLAELRWPRVEVLNLSRNRLRSVEGLASLNSLTALNLDHNRLEVLEADGPMSKMRTLRVSDNRLVHLDSSRFTGLRTLYADNNRLCEIRGVQRLRKLENLSLRNQGGKGLTLATRYIRDIKRLYLSGNPLVSSFIEEPCYNLIYLEVAACRLAALPMDLARLVPNVRVLNLNYNFLTEVRALDGLTRLRKLTLIGSRLTGTKSLVRMLRRMPEIEMLDCRMNPCTLGWYLPILVQGVPGALQPSEDAPGEGATTGAGSWQDLDAKFRRGLPDEAYVGRLAYRGLVMRACSKVKMLDGVAVERCEREKAERLLAGVLGAAGRA